jgi:two-component system, sensor histidine kinase and response regulator
MVIKRMLVKAGVEVTIANDGREAVQQAQAQSFDLILMDIQMPHMNGYEATRQIRNLESKIKNQKSKIPHVPIIALTAGAMKGDDQKCLEAGCDDYLVKPIDRKRLFAILEKYLSESGKTESSDLGFGISSFAKATEDGSDFGKTNAIPGENPQSEQSAAERIDGAAREVQELTEICNDVSVPSEIPNPQPEIPVDWSELIRRLDNDEDLIRDVVAEWLIDNSTSMAALGRAVKTKNAQDISTLAHAMKGSAAVISAHALTQAALSLEMAGIEEKLEDTDVLMTDVRTECEKLKAFLSQANWVEVAKALGRQKSESCRQLS